MPVINPKSYQVPIRSSASVIEAAMAFPMRAVLERYAVEHDLPLTIAEEHVLELRRYLVLCALNPETYYGMRGPIDELWHTFILFTEAYAEFCNSVAGRFLHHQPAATSKQNEYGFDDADQAPNRSPIRAGYVRFLADYESIFGEVPPRYLWPRPMVDEADEAEFLGCGCGCGCGCSCGVAVAERPRPQLQQK